MENKTKLDMLREEINEIDREIVHLYEKRMDAAFGVGKYKKEHGMEVFVAEREKEVLKTRKSWVENPAYQMGAEELFECLMGISRSLQHETVPQGELASGEPVKNPTVAFSGVAGCYAEEALKKYFGAETKSLAVDSFEEVFLALSSGQADYGVVPVENTSTGAIGDVLDLLGTAGLYIVGQTVIEINHCLMGLPDAESSDICEVYSHPQGLSQSRDFLKTLENIKQIPYYNTAASAKFVKDEKDKSKAAVASRHAAELYGLKILAEGINRKDNNHTRFAVIGKHLEIADEANVVSIELTLKHESGALKRVLSQFAQAGLNLLHIESRPLADKNFEYRFFIDFDGNLKHDGVQDALAKAKGDCLTLRVLGNYKGN